MRAEGNKKKKEKEKKRKKKRKKKKKREKGIVSQLPVNDPVLGIIIESTLLSWSLAPCLALSQSHLPICICHTHA